MAKHMFLCPADLEKICSSTTIPKVKFDVTINNIHIHYIPSIDKSFLIDDDSLNR